MLQRIGRNKTNKLAERLKTISFLPFPYELTIVVSNDIRQSIAIRSAKFNLDRPTANMGACVYGLGNGQCLMFIPESAPMDILVHECSHVVWLLLEHCGVRLDTEIVAYYTGFLSLTVWNFVYTQVKREPALRRPRRKKV